jgi:hypothetical protein
VPVWNQALQQYVRDGKLVVLGVAQEQHPQRNRLFTQWHRIDWPILYDPLNLMQVRGVPIEVAIDEHGIVRSTRIKRETIVQDFINKSFSAEGVKSNSPIKPVRPDVSALHSHAERVRSSGAWRELGDALVLWQGPDKLGGAIEAYAQAIKRNAKDGDSHFRLGVCYRMRYESEQRQGGDFQAAIDVWTEARAINPNQYIWRRRVEQYGPRQIKPYPFYDWVHTAAREIEARGETPIELKTHPTGSEMAQPKRDFEAQTVDTVSPDPQGRVFRDTRHMVLVEVTVVPPRVQAGKTARVYVTLRPNTKQKAHWNNEAEPLRLWIDPPVGLKVPSRLLTAPQGTKPETGETRAFEFEIQTPTEASGTVTMSTYALYYVCEDVSGSCVFLRQDIPITVAVSK